MVDTVEEGVVVAQWDADRRGPGQDDRGGVDLERGVGDKLGWTPGTSVEELAAMMVDHDLELASQEKTLRDAGHTLPNFVGYDQ
ncbi:MAG: hypothetical protein AAF586_11120 [Planctomycetota bacterium]